MRPTLIDLYRYLGPVDGRNVRRDPLLWWAGVLPFAAALVYRLFVPWLRGALLRAVEFDLAPYYPLIASSFVTVAPGIVGMVAGFLLLDERDDGVLTAIAVTPVAPATYLAYRISAPLLVAVVVTVIAYPIIGLLPLRLVDLVAVSVVASLVAPMTALFLAVFAQNKVSGFAMVKILNAINIAPVAAWFIDPPWQWLAGIVPAYWPMKMVWSIAEGRSTAVYIAAGLIAGVMWIAVLQRDLFRSAGRRFHV